MSEFGEIFKVRCGWWRNLRLKEGQAGTELTETGGVRGDTGDRFGTQLVIPALGSGGKEDQECKVIFTYMVNEFWASLAYMRLCLKKRRIRREEGRKGTGRKGREESSRLHSLF